MGAPRPRPPPTRPAAVAKTFHLITSEQIPRSWGRGSRRNVELLRPVYAAEEAEAYAHAGDDSRDDCQP